LELKSTVIVQQFAGAWDGVLLVDGQNLGGRLSAYALGLPGFGDLARASSAAPWPVTLYALQAELLRKVTTTYYLKEGVALVLVGLADTSKFIDLARGIQSMVKRVSFVGQIPLNYGFGVKIGVGGVDASDVLMLRALYSLRDDS